MTNCVMQLLANYIGATVCHRHGPLFPDYIFLWSPELLQMIVVLDFAHPVVFNYSLHLQPRLQSLATDQLHAAI